jgi:hypothetical protein
MPLPSGDEAGVEGPGSGVTDGLAGAVAVFAPADEVAVGALEVAVGAPLVQLAAGAGPLPFAVPDAAARVLDLGLAGALPLGLALAVGLALPPGLALALTLLLLGLALPLAWDGLVGFCGVLTLGLVGVPVGAADPAGLAAADFAEPDARDWDGDEHGAAAGLVFPGEALPSSLLVPGA